MPNKVGVHLGYYPAETDWAQVAALHPNGFLILDEYDLPGDWLPGHIVVYRAGSDIKHVVRSWAPTDYARFIRWKHQTKGNRHIDDLIFLNEPNLPEESGYEDPAEAIAHTVAWGLAVVAELRALYPGRRIHSPPLSPSTRYGAWRVLYEQMRPLIESCDILDVHSYFGGTIDLDYLHRLYPDKPVIISECGGPYCGTAAYGRQLVRYWRSLPSFVEFACPFIWTAPAGNWADWVLQNTPAARVILEAGL